MAPASTIESTAKDKRLSVMKTTYWLLVIAVQAFLLVSAWLALLVFQAWSVSSIIGTWTWAYGENDLWQRFRDLLTIPYHMQDGHAVLQGWDSLNMIFYTFCAAVVAFCFSVYTMLPNKSPVHDALNSTMISIWLPVRRLLTWQLPFRRLWLNWCSGLNAMEALLWSGWVVVHAVGLWDMLVYFKRGRLQGFDMVGMSYYVPTSVLRLYNISIAISWMIYINTAILFFPVAHSSFLNRMLGLPYAALVRFHRWIGHFALWTTLLHGLFFYAFWIADPTINFWDAFFDWGDEYGIVSFAGTIALCFGLLLWATSVDWVRRNCFKLFYYCHIFGFIGYLVFALIHYYWGWFGLFPSLFLYASDLVVRSYYAQKGCYVHAFKLSEDGQMAEVTIIVERGTFHDTTRLEGAHVFLKVPAVSRLDYHPFSIVSTSKDPVMGCSLITIQIKKYNRWSQDLLRLLSTTSNALPVNIWKPFDKMEPSSFWEQYESIMMVAGGIAVTPMIAILNELMASRSKTGSSKPAKVLLLFSARHISEFSTLDERVVDEAVTGDWLEVQTYYTGTGAFEALRRSKGDGKCDSITKDLEDKEGGTKLELELSKQQSSSDASWAGLPTTTIGRTSKACWGLLHMLFPADFMTDAQLVWVVLLAYLGGYMGIIMAQSAAIEILGMNDYFHDGYWRVGLVTAASVCVQAVGLPALFVIFPAYCVRFWKWCHGKNLKPVFMGRFEFSTTLRMETGQIVSREGGTVLDVRGGRPDIDTAVTAFVESARAAGKGRVAIISGGPDPMMHAVSMCVSKLNDKFRAAAVDLHQVAHSL